MGYIFQITNITNDKKYIGQTSRNVDTRFEEIAWDTRATSLIHQDIQKYGMKNFKYEILEEVELSQLDLTWHKWVKYLHTDIDGYNYNYQDDYTNTAYCLQIVENQIIFASVEDMFNLIRKFTNWPSAFLTRNLYNAINHAEKFLDYHIQVKTYSKNAISSIDEQENWVKTLIDRYRGKHIHCIERDLDFETVYDAAAYLLMNYYTDKSYTPLLNLVADINQNIKKQKSIRHITQELNFEEVPGAVTNSIENFYEQLYCKQLNIYFDDINSAVSYMINNHLWTKITTKTAYTHIYNMIKGYEATYQNYSIIPAAKDGSLIIPVFSHIQDPYLLAPNTSEETENRN